MGLFKKSSDIIDLEDIVFDTETEIIGKKNKKWGIRKSDGKRVLIKRNMCTTHKGRILEWWTNVLGEYYSSKIFELFGVPCQKVQIGYARRGKDKFDKGKKAQIRAVIESVLNEDEELIEFNLCDLSMKSFLEKYIAKIKELGANQKEIESIVRDTVRIAFIRTLLADPDWQYNSAIIHNKKDGTYRCAPALDSERAFCKKNQPWCIREPMEEIFRNYYEYIEDLVIRLEQNLKKIVDIVDDRGLQKNLKATIGYTLELHEKYKEEDLQTNEERKENKTR